MNKILRVTNILALAFVVVFCMSSCNDRLRKELSRAESLLDNHPDSALAVVNAIDSTVLRAKSLMAEYRVIRAMALDKNDVDDGCYASALLQSVEYYDRHPSRHKRERMLAHYYLGDQYLDSGYRLEAILHLTAALDLAEPLEDWFYCGMACKAMAQSYTEVYDSSMELEYYRKSLDFFNRTDRVQHIDYVETRLEASLYNNYDFDEAVQMIKSRLSEKKSMTREYLCDSYVILCDSYNYTNPPCPDSVIVYSQKIKSLGYSLEARTYSSLSRAYLSKGDFKSSRDALLEGYEVSESRKDSAMLALVDYNLSLKQNDFKHALSSLEYAWGYHLKAINPLLMDYPLSELSGIYHRQEKIVDGQYSRISTLLFIVAALLILVICLSILLVISHRRMLQSERNRYADLKNKMDAYRETLKGALDFAYTPLSELYTYTYDGADAAQYRKILYDLSDDVALRESNLKRMESTLDMIYGGIVIKLREQVTTLKKSEIELFVCLLFGMSYKSIAVFAPAKKSEPLSSVYKRAYLLREKIQKSNALDRDLFLSAIPLRSTNGKSVSAMNVPEE